MVRLIQMEVMDGLMTNKKPNIGCNQSLSDALRKCTIVKMVSSHHLRHRSLGHKRSITAREFALGIEVLEHFVAKQPFSKNPRMRFRCFGDGKRTGGSAIVIVCIRKYF